MTKPSRKGEQGVKYFDLDEVVQEAVIIKIFNEEHELKAVSVEDFIHNTKEQNELEAVAENDLAGNLKLTQKMLRRAFPSLPEDIFARMSMLQLNKLVQLAHGLNGQKDAEAQTAAAVSAENPPGAGQ